MKLTGGLVPRFQTLNVIADRLNLTIEAVPYVHGPPGEVETGSVVSFSLCSVMRRT